LKEPDRGWDSGTKERKPEVVAALCISGTGGVLECSRYLLHTFTDNNRGRHTDH